MIRTFLLLIGAVVALTACATDDLDEAPVELGDFKLGHNIVVAPSPQVVPGSSEVSDDEWIAAVTGAVDARFGRYEGEGLYHFGISVDAYLVSSLDTGIPGVPGLKSLLALNVTLWDNEKQAKLNPEPERIIVTNVLSGKGPFPKKEDIIQVLSDRAAKSIETWLVENQVWFAQAELDSASNIDTP